MAAISERPITQEQRDCIGRAADGVARALGLDARESPAAEVVGAINDCVRSAQKEDTADDVDTWVDLSLPFGCLWGEQMVREFAWERANVTFHDHGDDEAFGVFSSDRSLAIYPSHFILGCIESQAVVTILVAFKMLKDGTKIPDLPAHGYEDVMDHVQYIVPPV